ncbi:tetratricopeptide repeat protein [Rhodanobacter sp. L36]|uniref:tetratricopeptide repeat protein n=1 Tax=Rhodanobacter sp. L36 TaxID=1747221 RepID=UPI00131AD9EF|nr:tetratricopeptide repeat protein [Rhodanobacter sp. L36]
MSSLPPALLDAMRQVGALLQSGDYAAAHHRLEILVMEHPDYVEALRLLAGTKQALGDVDAAEVLLRKAFAIDPNWAPTLSTLGELLLGRGRGDDAEPLLRRAAQRMPQAALALARHYNDTQRPTDALALVAPLCNAGQVDAELVAQHVAALAALGRAQEALDVYREMADTMSGSHEAAYALALALAAANEHAEAEGTMGYVLACGYRTAAVYFTRARSLVALGNFDRAEQDLRDCLQIDPRLADAHSHLARLIWMRTGDTRETTEVLDRALQSFPGDDALRAAKAAILQGAGDARGAYACLAEQVARTQASPALLVRAGLAALDVDPAAALTLAERALHASPNHQAARNLLVAAQLGVGDAQNALRHCEALLANTPDDQYLVALQTTAWRMLGDERYLAYCDYAALAVPQTLPVPSSWSNLPGFLADLKQSLERLHNPTGHPLLFQSLRHGTETTEDLTRSADPVIQALFKAFDEPIREYLARIGHGNDPLRRRNRGNYRFNGSWSVRLRSSGYHNNHVHPRGWISSAFYVDLPDNMNHASNNEGCLAFAEPGIVTTPPLHAEHVVRPQPGMLVLFPSYFWHGTVPFNSEQTRLTVAFDVLPDSSTEHT